MVTGKAVTKVVAEVCAERHSEAKEDHMSFLSTNVAFCSSFEATTQSNRPAFAQLVGVFYTTSPVQASVVVGINNLLYNFLQK